MKNKNKKKETFLSLYNQWIRRGKLPMIWSGGLCSSLPNHLYQSEAFKMIEPQTEDDIRFGEAYWGCGEPLASWEVEQYGFTPLRQTIMLLCACLNGEMDK